MIYSESELEDILKEPANAAPSRKDLARTALAYLRSARERETLLFQATDEINRLWDVIHERNLTGDIPAIPSPVPWPEAGAVEKPISEVETKFYQDGERVPIAPGSISLEMDGVASAAFRQKVMELCHDPMPKEWADEIKRSVAAHVTAALKADSEAVEGVTELFDSGPQRPHESLVWAMLFQAQIPRSRDGLEFSFITERMVENADALLRLWRRRWPEA